MSGRHEGRPVPWLDHPVVLLVALTAVGLLVGLAFAGVAVLVHATR